MGPLSFGPVYLDMIVDSVSNKPAKLLKQLFRIAVIQFEHIFQIHQIIGIYMS